MFTTHPNFIPSPYWSFITRQRYLWLSLSVNYLLEEKHTILKAGVDDCIATCFWNYLEYHPGYRQNFLLQVTVCMSIWKEHLTRHGWWVLCCKSFIRSGKAGSWYRLNWGLLILWWSIIEGLNQGRLTLHQHLSASHCLPFYCGSTSPGIEGILNILCNAILTK